MTASVFVNLSNKTITEVKPLLIVLVGSEIRSSLFGWGQLPSWGNSRSEWGLHFWPYQCWKVTKEQLSRPFSPFSDRNFLIYGTFYYFHFPNTSSVGNFFAQTPSKHRANSKMPTFIIINQKLLEIIIRNLQRMIMSCGQVCH